MSMSILENFRHPSLLRRLVVIMVLCGALASGTLALVIGWTVQSRELDSTFRLIAEGVLAIVQDDDDPLRIAERAQRIQAIDEASAQDFFMQPNTTKTAYQVFHRNAGLVFRTPGAPESPLASPKPGLRWVQADGSTWRIATVGTADGRMWVHVGTSASDRRKLLLIYSKFNFFLLGLGLLVASAPFAWAAHRGLKPLNKLTDLVRLRKRGDLRPLLPGTPYLETVPLVEALNQLLEETKNLLEVQRRFIADAAHELRTPLSVVSAQAHVLGCARTDEDRKQAQSELQDGLDRAALLIRQLLTVARLDTQVAQPIREPLDLDELMRGIVATQASRFLEAGLDLAYLGCGPVVLVGDGQSLRSAVENLLENALKYAGVGAQVELEVSQEGGEVCIRVADDGPGVAEEHLSRLFERFYRVPGTTAMGSGLGLAIVQRVVEEHGGTVIPGPGLQGHGLSVGLYIPVQ